MNDTVRSISGISLYPLAGYIGLGLLIAAGDLFVSPLLIFFGLVIGLAFIRFVQNLRFLVDLVEIIVLYGGLQWYVRITGIYQYVHFFLVNLLLALLLVAFNHRMRNRSWSDLRLRWEPWRAAWPWIFSLGALSILGLYLWYHHVLTDRSIFDPGVPHWPTWQLLAVVPIAAVANAIREEFIYRVIIQTEAQRAFGAWPAMLFQAVLFGTMHFRGGFPQGWSGVGLTSAFGFAMGLLMHKCRTVWPAVLIHAVADVYLMSTIVLNRSF